MPCELKRKLDSTEEILNANNIADYLHLSLSEVYVHMQRKRLPAFKIGGTWRIRKKDLDRWINENVVYKFKNLGFLAPSDAARYLGVSNAFFYQALHNKKIPAVKIAGRWRIDIVNIENLVEERILPNEIILFMRRKDYNKLKRNYQELKDHMLDYEKIKPYFRFYNLMMGYNNGVKDLIADLRQRIDYALEKLLPREKIVIEQRLGLNNAPMPLEAIGKELNITRERVRQIEAIALRKFKHIFPGLSWSRLLDKLDAERTKKASIYEDQPIQSFAFSVRVQNCFLNAGIQTIGDLILKTDQDLLEIENFGRGSLYEVKRRLVSLGLSFKI